MNKQRVYSNEPEDREEFTKKFDKVYAAFAKAYDVFAKVFPPWKRWLTTVIPYIEGPRVLEVSFGTGYLLAQYANRFETFGLDYNEALIDVTRKNLQEKTCSAHLVRGVVEALPYPDECFDTIVNTMAFTAYPDSAKALSELYRVLKPGGKFLLVDINYPANGNWLGVKTVKMWMVIGDLVRDVNVLLRQFHFHYTDLEIGGFGSVHLYVAEKE